MKQADSLNLKYLSLVSSIEISQATISAKDYARARQDLERDLSRSEKLGSRLESARIHYLLGEAIRLGGNSRDAVSQYAQALRLFDELKKDPGAEHLLDRSDLKEMYAELQSLVLQLRPRSQSLAPHSRLIALTMQGTAACPIAHHARPKQDAPSLIGGGAVLSEPGFNLAAPARPSGR